MGTFFSGERTGRYLVYCVDKRLSTISTEILDRLSLIRVGENVRNQGDALFCGVMVVDQAFPCWEATACMKPIRPANLGSKDKPHKSRETSSAWGRKSASWSQHRWTNAHNLSVKVKWVGRDGRSPPTIANIAA